jgi:hypothetical protein
VIYKLRKPASRGLSFSGAERKKLYLEAGFHRISAYDNGGLGGFRFFLREMKRRGKVRKYAGLQAKPIPHDPPAFFIPAYDQAVPLR